MGQSVKYHDACIRAHAANGASRAQLAEAIGCSYQGLYHYCRRNGIEFAQDEPGGRQPADKRERVDRMIEMHRQGVAMSDIGVKFKLTRERVRQLLAKRGVAAKDGGKALQAKLKQDARTTGVRARLEARWGVAYELARELRSNGTIRAFEQQRRSSLMRGIGWGLTFAQWYAIWQASGKLHLRGRGKGRYCMSRLQDSGAYELGNVHIQLAEENSREAVSKWVGKTKDIPGVFCLYPGRDKAWLAKVGKKSLGFFNSAEEAGAARDAYIAWHDCRTTALGRGRGWTYIDRLKARPYQVQVIGTKDTYHSTPEEARAEYLRRCAEVAAQRRSIAQAGA